MPESSTLLQSNYVKTVRPYFYSFMFTHSPAPSKVMRNLRHVRFWQQCFQIERAKHLTLC